MDILLTSPLYRPPFSVTTARAVIVGSLQGECIVVRPRTDQDHVAEVSHLGVMRPTNLSSSKAPLPKRERGGRQRG
jgi:hypothetical protein